jgi:hypothetical protein
MAWMKPRFERESVCEPVAAPVIMIERRTLAQRLGEGRLCKIQALRLAIEVAQALREFHDAGNFHGALTPFLIELSGSGIELRTARTRNGAPTPYTAPEVLQGQPADARSDVFSFGAILHEMITGRWPFEGDTPESLALELQNAPTPRTGDVAIDSLLTGCMTKDPAARRHGLRKAQTELKLALVAARGAETPVRREHFEAFVRAEVAAGLESHVTGRLESQAHAVRQLQQSASTSVERMNRVERAIETAEMHAAEFAGNAAAQLHALEQTVRAQAVALESARLALAQTDDLVERVVEALDSMQTIVLERSDFIAGAVAAPNSIRAIQPISE